ncbi:hypothetical protein [Ornithinimicrobium sp. W1665]|uniref:hypothetical protein n=1 Tax=Ornithinimicrobium sp. W1665 TaxID=3416666 RepID=UPI003D6AF119
MFYWILKHIVVGPAVRVVFRPWVEGREHVPASGGAILASNHLSFPTRSSCRSWSTGGSPSRPRRSTSPDRASRAG